MACNNAKKRDKKDKTKKKQIRTEGETIHPNPGNDEQLGEKEKNRKQKKRKGIETQRVDLLNPSQAIDAPIGD